MSVTEPAEAPARRRLSRDDRRIQLLDHAAALLLEAGIAAVTLEAVAARAGASRTLGYAYFEDREDLLRAVFEREAAALGERLATETAELASFPDYLRSSARHWFDLIDERGELLSVLTQYRSLRVGDEDLLATGGSQLMDFWAALGRREYGFDAATARAAAAMILQGILGATDAWRRHGVPRHVAEGTFVTVALGGLQALAAERGAAGRPRRRLRPTPRSR